MINYLVNQDESALMENDYKRLYPYLYGSLIEYWAKRRGLEASVVFSLIKAESSFEKMLSQNRVLLALCRLCHQQQMIFLKNLSILTMI